MNHPATLRVTLKGAALADRRSRIGGAPAVLRPVLLHVSPPRKGCP
ncbi:MAG: hypothetical protein R3E42_03865 [Burkholderiaceae bacterium]